MEDLKGKKLLILAGQDVHRKLVETAKSMGVYTIVLDYLENSPCKKIADETSMLSIMDVEGIVKFCKEHGVDGIANFCNDPASRIVQQVSEIMGYPNIGTKEQVFTFTNKVAFKQACLRNNVDVVPEYSEEDCEKGCIDFPVIVKPSDSRGSRGSSICHNQNELKKAIELAKENTISHEIIIEKCCSDLQEVEITYLVIDKKPYLISFADRYTGNIEDGVDKISSCIIEPSWFLNTYLEKVDSRVKDMLINEGINNTAIIMQGFIDGQTVRMFDPGFRFQGNEFERVLLRACGVNAMESVITYALTGKMKSFDGKYEESYNLNGKCAVQYMVNGRAGKISSFEGVDRIVNDPRCVYLGYKYDLGESLESTGDTKQRLFDITFLIDRTRDEVIDVIDFVNNNLKVLDENERDMIISKFDYRNIEHPIE